MDGYPAWRDATLGERVQMVAIQIFVWSIVFPIGLIGLLTIFGIMIEGGSEYRIERSRCQKQAITPYEYHQCR